MSSVRSFGRAVVAAAVLLSSVVVAAVVPAAAPVALAVSPNVVISQVYGGGGNSGATYTHDFVELFNRGTSSVSLTGMSIQYASSTGSFGSVTALSGSLAPGQYLLIQMAAGTGGTTALPTPDVTGTTAMSATTGKIAVVNGTIALGCGVSTTPCSSTQLAQIVDLIGYGTANLSEGTAAPALSNTTAALRAGGGCTDTDSNAADFTAVAPAPRNSATALAPCTAPPALSLSIDDVSQDEGDNGTSTFSFTVALSAPAPAGGVSFDIATSDGTASAGSDYVAAALTGQTIPAGSTSSPFDVTVNGDVAFEADETLFVNLTNVSGATVVDGQGQGTVVNDDVASPCSSTTTPIASVQGTGASSPLAGQTVTVRGVVVGDFQGTSGLNGFHLQDPVGDGNPDTSDGIFVFVPSGNPLRTVDVNVGDDVVVTGRAIEFQDLTEIDMVTAITSCGSVTPLAPTTLSLPETVEGELERYEAMLVSIPQTLTVQQNFFQGRFGQVTLGVDRLVQPTNRHPAGSAEAVALADLNNRSLIVLDDGRGSQNPNPIPYIGEDGTLRAGDTIAGVTGVLDDGAINSNTAIRDYRVHPTVPVTITRVNERTATPPSVGGNLTVASFNVLNYFNGDGAGGGFPTTRGANTAAEFARQRAKTIAAITAMDADVVGLMEMENDGTGPLSAIQDLVHGLNAATAPGTYAFVVDPAPGTDEIRVALIYRPAAVTPVGVAQNFQTSDPTYGELLFDRPPLAQTFEHAATGERITVVVNHFKSKGSCPVSFGPDADQGDGQGCWNAKRVRQAQELLAFTGSLQSSSEDADVLVIGDLNSYAMEDPIQVLRGAGYVDEIHRALGDDAYSYVFDGLAGYLDHALATSSLSTQVSGVAEWHINADEPSVIDYNTEFKPQDLYTPTPYRSSDHDPVIVGLALERPNRAPVATADSYATTEDTTLTVSAPGVLDNDSDPDTDAISAQLVTGPSNGALVFVSSGAFTYTPAGNTSGQDSFTYRACDSSGACSSATTVSIDVTALSPAQEIARLEAAVRSLRTAGVLNRSDANGLLAKLAAASSAFARNRIRTACNNLQAFVNQVVDLRTIGTLDAAQADALIAGAVNLRQESGC